MTTSPLKVEGSRADFEAWASENHGFNGIDFEWHQTRNCYASFGIHFAYKAWKASRASIVVTLPEKSFIPESDKLYPDLAEWPNGYNSGIDDSASAIRAAGITVKGDS